MNSFTPFDLRGFIPEPAPAPSVHRFGTITSLTPLTVITDAPHSITLENPINLLTGLSIGARVDVRIGDGRAVLTGLVGGGSASITITLNAGWSVSAGPILAVRAGDRTELQGSISGPISTALQTVATLPPEWHPPRLRRFASGGTGGRYSAFEITTTGNINVYSTHSPAPGWFSLDAAWWRDE